MATIDQVLNKVQDHRETVVRAVRSAAVLGAVSVDRRLAHVVSPPRAIGRHESEGEFRGRSVGQTPASRRDLGIRPELLRHPQLRRRACRH